MDFAEKIREDVSKRGIDVSPNNPVDDLFIKTYIELNQQIEEEIQNMPLRLAFKNFNNLSREDQIKFASNFFVEVSDGKKSIGKVWLEFDSPIESYIPKGTIFKTKQGLEFESVSTNDSNEEGHLVLPEQMVNNTDGMYYYHEIEVMAKQAGTEYNVNPNEVNICESSIIMDRVVRIKNPYKLDGGINAETPEQLYSRIPDALSIRDLSNDPAIKTVVRANFSSVIEIFNVRTGDSSYMHRDIVWIPLGTGGYTKNRVGNKHDIWLYLDDLTHYTVDITATQNGPILPFGYGIIDVMDRPIEQVVLEIVEIAKVDSNGTIIGSPISDYKFIEDPGNDIASAHSSTPRKYLENSQYQQSQISITESFNAGQRFRITFVGSSLVPFIQDFVENPKNRMPTGDPLVKHFKIYPLRGIIYYKGNVEEDVLTDALNKFMKYYHYNPERQAEDERLGKTTVKYIEVSDLIQEAYKNGVKKVQLPLELTLVKYGENKTDVTFDDEITLKPFEVVRPEIVAVKLE